jgi:hypothetical protein
MAPPRSLRDEALTLRKPGAPDRELVHSRETGYGFDFPTQRRYQVSPDARVLAYSEPHGNKLHVLRRDGASMELGGFENEELRFSPDGKFLALVRWQDRARRVERIDLHAFTSEAWADIPGVLWMEFCAEGLVVLHVEEGTLARLLTLLPWSGEPRTIVRADHRLSRFVAAKAGSRIVYFLSNDVFAIDIDAEDSAPKSLGRTRIFVKNAEMSPDGRAVVLSTGEETYFSAGESPLAIIAERGVHTIWFSRDGSAFVWANDRRATWRRGDLERSFEAGEGETIRAVRFLQASPGLVVTRSRDVARWNPERDESDVIARAGEGQEMLGADVFGGGLVLWTGTPWVWENSLRK